MAQIERRFFWIFCLCSWVLGQELKGRESSLVLVLIGYDKSLIGWIWLFLKLWILTYTENNFWNCCFIETVRDYELQYHHRLEQERAQWNQYRENVEREIAELRRRLSEGQEEENLENEMKKVCWNLVLQFLIQDTLVVLCPSSFLLPAVIPYSANFQLFDHGSHHDLILHLSS